MTKEKLSKKELEQLCVRDKILLERKDPVSNSYFLLPNLEKIGIMIRDFDFLVEGASRGKAINEISKIERYLYDNEGNPEVQNKVLASNYTKVSIYIEEKMDFISDKNSDNWNSLFTRYFSIEDIYNYFHKTESASSFFRKYAIYKEMVDVLYHLKLMEYLESQIQLFIPLDDDKEIPYQMDSLELKILVLYKTGFIQRIKEEASESYYVSGAKLIATLLNLQPNMWKLVSNILRDIDAHEDESILNNEALKNQLKEILYHYRIDLRN